MLTQLELDHFKCFEHIKLTVGQLTLLSGPNASGKSSLLQALGLLHQTIREHEWSTRLHLNGEGFQLGTVADIVDKVSGRQSFGIGLVFAGESITWRFDAVDRRDMSAAVSLIKVGTKQTKFPKTLRFLLPSRAENEHHELATRLKRLTYLTAERVGPRDVYPLEDPAFTQVVGPRGESAVSLLYWGRDERVLDALVLQGTPPKRLHQVEARMKEFFPNCSLSLLPVPQANGVTLGLRTSDATDFHRPIHVGFGLTQVLPIIVAALSAERNDMLLIENPEVHLHPAGQGKMGIFLALVAAAGIQVFAETHSDHVLNGIRMAVRKGILSPDKVAVHFFRPRDAEKEQIVSPKIDRHGKVDQWPAGFFDETEKMLFELL